MQLSGQLGSILAHQRTRQALQTLQRSQALNLFLTEKRLTGEIALALSHRLNNLLTQSISYYELSQLYEPFFTTKAEGQKDKALEHLGLDLALVHAFALSLGSRLEYRNSCGTGACFILALRKSLYNIRQGLFDLII